MRVPEYQKPVEILIENTINLYVMACPAKLDLLCQISQKMILTMLLIPNTTTRLLFLLETAQAIAGSIMNHRETVV